MILSIFLEQFKTGEVTLMKWTKSALFFFLLVILSACMKETPTFFDVEKEIVFTFTNDDDQLNVTDHISIEAVESKFKDVSVTYLSNDDSVGIIKDGKIEITRKDVDKELTITAIITIGGKEKRVDYHFIVKGLTETNDTVTITVVTFDDEIEFTLKKNSTFSEDLSVSGYLFKGLFLDEQFEIPFNSVVTEDITLYAKYEISQIDNEKPVITGVKPLTILLGNEIDLLRDITVTDNMDKDILLSVDDSKVNYQVAGTYPIVYYAKDRSDNVTSIEVTLTIKANIQVETIETFDQIGNIGSSYAFNTFISDNGLTWDYMGMRDDIALNGKALTFGQTNSFYLKTLLNDGIDSLSIDFAHAFSGSSTRNIDLYLNGELTHTFLVTADKRTYEVSNLGLTGKVTFELRNSGGNRVTVDNIKIRHQASSPDYNALLLDRENLNLPNVIKETQTIVLPKTGLNGSTITYEYLDKLDPNNSLLNLETGLATIVLNEVRTVSVLVTLSKGVESINFVYHVGLADQMAVKIGVAKKDSGLVKTAGNLTGYYIENNQIRAFFQDETDGLIVLLDQSYLSMLVVGYRYIIKGEMSLSIEPMIINVKEFTKSFQSYIRPQNPLYENLNINGGKYVFHQGLYISHTSKELHLAIGENIAKFDISKVNFPINVEKLSLVSITGYVDYLNQSYQVIILDSNEINVEAVDLFFLNYTTLSILGLEDGMTISEDITLEKRVSLLGLDIIYQSANANILSHDGKITTTLDEASVKLNYQIKLDGVLLFESSLNIHILKGNVLDGYYEEASGLTGVPLLESLTRIISRNYTSISYSATNAVLEKADKHPSGSGYLGIYDHTKITSYNKEHVWPQSSFSEAMPYKSDMHHLRISVVSTNSTRSNYYFNNPTSPTSNWQVGNSRFFPGDLDKGDIARMLLYMAVRYRNDNFKLIIADSGRTSNAPSRSIGNILVLLDWHLQDPVDDFEKNRNEVIYGTQKNRNPFIDHPELFEDVYGVLLKEAQSRKISFNPIDEDFLMQYNALETLFIKFEVIIENEKAYLL